MLLPVNVRHANHRLFEVKKEPRAATLGFFVSGCCLFQLWRLYLEYRDISLHLGAEMQKEH
jgi:hypothetical protein